MPSFRGFVEWQAPTSGDAKVARMAIVGATQRVISCFESKTFVYGAEVCSIVRSIRGANRNWTRVPARTFPAEHSQRPSAIARHQIPCDPLPTRSCDPRSEKSGVTCDGLRAGNNLSVWGKARGQNICASDVPAGRHFASSQRQISLLPTLNLRRSCDCVMCEPLAREGVEGQQKAWGTLCPSGPIMLAFPRRTSFLCEVFCSSNGCQITEN